MVVHFIPGGWETFDDVEYIDSNRTYLSGQYVEEAFAVFSAFPHSNLKETDVIMFSDRESKKRWIPRLNLDGYSYLSNLWLQKMHKYILRVAGVLLTLAIEVSQVLAMEA